MKRQIALSLIAGLLALTNVIGQNYIPVATTGYTLDGVAENTTAIANTTGPMDASNFNLYSQYYGTLYTPAGPGLPNNGLVAVGTRTYQLQAYNVPNVLFIPANLKDSLTFVTPQPFPSISLLSFATQGNATMSVTVRFTDNTTQVFSPIALSDWFTATPNMVYSGFDRVLRTTGVPANVGGAGNPKMFGTDLAIACANQGKLIKRVVVQNNSTAYVCAMAVAGNPPGYSVSGNTSICSSATSTLNATGFSTYTWQPVGAFAGSNAASINVNPTANTTYTLEGTDASGCPGYTTITVSVNSGAPVLSLAGSTQSVCLGAAATLTASGAATYTWTGGVSNGVAFYPTTTTTYTVSGQNGCGITTSVATIAVGPIPVSLATTANTVCTNKTATLTITAAANSFTLLPNNSVTSSSIIIVNPQVNTVYTVAASNGTCGGFNTISIQADPIPTITSSSSAPALCPGGSITLSASGGINYTWSPTNQNTSSVNVSPLATTLYTVTGDNSFGCHSSTTQLVLVGAQPTIAITTSNFTICNGSSATFTASGANTYAWAGGPTTNTYVVSPTQLSTYTVTGTNTTSGCSNTRTVTVDVFTPSVGITGNFTICAGGQANLNGTGAANYTWNPGGSPFAGISVSPPANTIYTVSAVGSSGSLNCPVDGTVEVVVNPNPTLTSVATPTAVCIKNTMTLTASGASTYTWSNTSASVNVSASSLTVSSTKATVLVYTLTGTNAFGCESSLSVPVNISACNGIFETSGNTSLIVVYPNPSSGDFSIQGSKELKLNIVNQLGQVVRTLELNTSNNQRALVTGLPEGIYFVVGENLNTKIIVGK